MARFFVYTMRDPRGMVSITMMGIGLGVISGLVFYHVGEK